MVASGLMGPLSESARAFWDGTDSNSALLCNLVWKLGVEPKTDLDSDLNAPGILRATSTVVLYICFKFMGYSVERSRMRSNMRQLEVNILFNMCLTDTAYQSTVVYPWTKLGTLSHPLGDNPVVDDLPGEICHCFHGV